MNGRSGWLSSVIMLFYVLCFLASNPSTVLADNVLGCGGFAKISPDLKSLVGTSKATKKVLKAAFSGVKVQLVTSSGAVHDETFCAPNGYYFLPMDDSSAGEEFTLRVQGPAGWTVAKNEYEVTSGEDSVDGCEQDVNFEFTGFSVQGSLSVFGKSAACKDAQIQFAGLELESTLDSKKRFATTTGASGSFIFEGVLPGTYEIKFVEEETRFGALAFYKKTDTKVVVEAGSLMLPMPLQVEGFVAKGEVWSSSKDKTGVEGVTMFLYGKGKVPSGCSPVPPSASVPLGQKTEPLCMASTDKNGRFSVSGLRCGKAYSLIPFFQGKQTSFNVVPAVAKVEALPISAHYISVKPFHISGFSIGGKVTDHGGNGVEGAVVKFEGGEPYITDASGGFTLSNVQEGRFSFTIEKEGFAFGDLSRVPVKPSTKGLPPFAATGYSLCGIVESGSSKGMVVELRKNKKVLKRATVDVQTGKYCFEGVPPGKHYVSVKKKASVTLSPSQHVVDVAGPTDSIDFGLSMVAVSGALSCIKNKCPEGVSLELVKRKGGKNAIASTDVSETGKFVFKSVPPGHYTVRTSSAGNVACWGTPEKVAKDLFQPFLPNAGGVAVEVGVDDLVGVQLHQTGFQVQIRSPYKKISVTLARTKKKKKGTRVPIKGEKAVYELRKGSNTICVPKSGTYSIFPPECHQFTAPAYHMKTGKSKGSIDIIEVASTKISGTVQTKNRDAEPAGVKVTLVDLDDGRKTFAEAVNEDGQYSFWAKPGHNIELSVQDSDDFIFQPKLRTARVPAFGCSATVKPFQAYKGVVLKGTIRPALEDVEITIESSDAREDIVVTSNPSGRWRSPSLKAESAYKVVARKEGYHFQQAVTVTAGDAKENIVLKHSKLASVRVTVRGAGGGKPIGDVLLSLSGDSYRNNSKLNEDGTMLYSSLFPGSYFIRPSLKEYTFEPASKSFDLESAEELKFEFSGKRVAYSCYGTLVSLNGQPQEGVTVIAVGLNGQREEAVSGSNGDFRIRGLKPNSGYTLSVGSSTVVKKEKSRGNRKNSGRKLSSQFVRAIPEKNQIFVKEGGDVSGVEFVVIKEPSSARVTGNVDVEGEHVDGLTVVLARATAPSTPIKRVPVRRLINYFEFTNVPAGNYVLYTESSKVSAKYFSIDAPKVDVTVPSRSDTPSIHTQLSFSASASSLEEDIESGSFFSLVFGIVIVFSIINHTVALELLMPMLKILSSVPILGGWVRKIVPKEKSYGTSVGGFSMSRN